MLDLATSCHRAEDGWELRGAVEGVAEASETWTWLQVMGDGGVDRRIGIADRKVNCLIVRIQGRDSELGN